MPASVTIVLDNSAALPHLKSEPGFAAWIETPDRRVLFDTGTGQALSANLEGLGLPLARTDAVVVSHGHFDHTGGLPAALAAAPNAVVYGHPAFRRERFAVRNGLTRSIGVSPAVRRALEQLPSCRLQPVDGPLDLAPDLGLTGPIPREVTGEDTGGPFFLDPAATRPDPLEDDLALWIRTTGGLVLIVGCSHAGLINTVRRGLATSGEPRLRAVLGGFHLREADDRRLERTARALRELAPARVVPCHCTGERAVQRLAGVLGERVVPGAAGMTFRFD